MVEHRLHVHNIILYSYVIDKADDLEEEEEEEEEEQEQEQEQEEEEEDEDEDEKEEETRRGSFPRAKISRCRCDPTNSAPCS